MKISRKNLIISLLVCICIAAISMLPIYALTDAGSANGNGSNGGAIGNGISEIGNGIGNAANNAGDAIRNGARDTGNGLRDATDDIAEGIGDAANDVTGGVKDAMDGSDRPDNNGKVTDTDGDITNDGHRDTGVLDATDSAEDTENERTMNYVWIVIGIVAAVAALVAILLLMPKRGTRHSSSNSNGR